MPGPTLLLMLLLILPYLLFLDSRRSGHLDVGALSAWWRWVRSSSSALLWCWAKTLFPHRLEAVTSGNDPSFFYRVQGPALAGLDIMMPTIPSPAPD